jgi:integrase
LILAGKAVANEKKYPSGHLCLAVLLLLSTGQRRSDAVRMKWSQFDGEIIEVPHQQKTNEYVAIPCHHRLRSVLSTLPRRSEYILTGERGTPYHHPQSLAAAVRRQLHALGIRGYSVHGLRKNAAKALAEVGCSVSEIMAVTGHRTPAMAMMPSARKRSCLLSRQSTAGKPPKCLTCERSVHKAVSTLLKNHTIAIYPQKRTLVERVGMSAKCL